MLVANDDRLERLRLLGSAIAGSEVQVAATVAGEPAWTDGTTVYIDATDGPASQVQALALQASLLAAGSLEPSVLRQIRRHRNAARYLAVEGHRALALNEPYLPSSVRAVIDREVAGSVENVDASLAVALGRQAVADPPPTFGTIRPRQALATAARSEAATGTTDTPSHDSPGSLLPELEEDEAEADDPRDLGQLLTSPVGGGGPIGRLLQRLLAQTRERGGGGSPGADAPTRIGRAGPSGGAAAVVTAGAASALDGGTETGRNGLTYPEWNVHRNRYRPDWCTVIESDPTVETRAPMTMPDGLAFRRPLARLGMGLVPCRRQLQGDDIDIDAAVEARVDGLAGSTPSEALYVESLRRRRDLSVLILLDVSGSAGEPGAFGRPVHEHQRLAAAALTTALHDLGDRVALYAFNSQGRTSVRVMRVKGFDEGLDRRVGQRLGGLVPGAYTRLGAAIRHGSSLVEDHGGTSRRLLVVLSDGFAYDHGYEGRYGEADARRALAESRRRGVGCLCLSIGAGVEAATLRRVFGTAAHASVSTVDQLPPIISPLFRSALRSAEARRRVHQRTERTRERLEIERRAS